MNTKNTLLILGGVILICSFLPWMEFLPQQIEFEGADAAFFGGFPPISIEINGWSGTLTVAGIKMPTWFFVLSGLIAALLGWLTLDAKFTAPRMLLLTMAAICSLGSSYIFVVAMISANAGLGSIGTGIAGIALWNTLRKNISPAVPSEANEGTSD